MVSSVFLIFSDSRFSIQLHGTTLYQFCERETSETVQRNFSWRKIYKKEDLPLDVLPHFETTHPVAI